MEKKKKKKIQQQQQRNKQTNKTKQNKNQRKRKRKTHPVTEYRWLAVRIRWWCWLLYFAKLWLLYSLFHLRVPSLIAYFSISLCVPGFSISLGFF